jgi:hypothetical protein
MNKLAGMLLVIFVTVFGFTGCKPSEHEAVEYNDRIINQQRAINGKEQEMIAALEDSTAVESAYKAYIAQVQASLDSINAMNEFAGSHELKDAALRLFNLYKEVGANEYREIVSLMKKSDESLTDEDKARVSALLNDVTKKLNAEVGELNKAQDKFAREYHIQIEGIEEAKENR